MNQLDRVRRSSAESSGSSKRHSEDESRDDLDVWSNTTGSPADSSPRGRLAGEDAIKTLEDVDEHEYLLEPRNASRTGSRSRSSMAREGPQGSDGPSKSHDAPVTWKSLPNKSQLFLLMLARCAEPLMATSLQSYMYYQLKSFDPTLPGSTIASQVGLMQASFTMAQFITAFLWGKAADSARIGRKRVLVIGLLGTGLSCIGFGFSRTFVVAIVFRSLGGALNGNVGVMRTMISEIVKEKKYQSRAFMILPMTFNIGIIIGPTLGGLLADPVKTYPSVFGPGSKLGGKDGVWWMTHWPFALPNLLSAGFLLGAMLLLLLGLDETHYRRVDKPDWGRTIGRAISRFICRRSRSATYSALPTEEQDVAEQMGAVELQLSSGPSPLKKKSPSKRLGKLPFRRIWTRNVLFVFLSHGLLAFHVGSFNSLWFVFLSTPRFDPSHPDPPSAKDRHLPFGFTGGFAMSPASVGLSLSIIGMIGITLQVLIYPRLSGRYGNVRCYRAALLLFPLVYLLAPYLSLIYSSTAPPAAASGVLVWAGISFILFLQVLARTFALPANIILVNNSCPHPSVLGSVHGLSQSLSSGMRTLGPVIGGWVFGYGLKTGVIGLAFWLFAIEAMVGSVASCFVAEGSGHEILLPGEEAEGEREQEEEDKRDDERARETNITRS